MAVELKKKIEMKPGEKLKGYGLLNEFGEFEFIPEKTGSRQGAIKLVKETDCFTISTTKTKILVHLRLDKMSGMALVTKFLSESTNILNILKGYDF